MGQSKVRCKMWVGYFTYYRLGCKFMQNFDKRKESIENFLNFIGICFGRCVKWLEGVTKKIKEAAPSGLTQLQVDYLSAKLSGEEAEEHACSHS